MPILDDRGRQIFLESMRGVIMLLPRQRVAAVMCALVALMTTAEARPHGDVASVYSSGRITASGEKFDKAALKAAHRTLPFGSQVNVVNRSNGQSVVVEI